MGKPIEGASVLYDHSGTITDLDGIFYINSNIGTQIRVQHIGYKTKVIIADSDFIDKQNVYKTVLNTNI